MEVLNRKKNEGKCVYEKRKKCLHPQEGDKCRKIGCPHFKRKVTTYYLTLSQVFPSTHARAGQPTNFRAAFNNAQMCAKCQEKPKGMCMGECVVGYLKKHTIRANYEFWAKRFEKIAAGEAVLSIREWVGKPYGKGSTQREIALLTREDGIGLQKMTVAGTCTCHPIFVDGVSVPVKRLAANDGLSDPDWRNWFEGYDLTEPLAVIQFTKFRYKYEKNQVQR